MSKKGRCLDVSTDAAGPGPAPARPFVGVRFDCCGVYTRIYLNQAGDAYEGRCPRCVRAIRFDVGPGGTQARFFSAS